MFNAHPIDMNSDKFKLMLPVILLQEILLSTVCWIKELLYRNGLLRKFVEYSPVLYLKTYMVLFVEGVLKKQVLILMDHHFTTLLAESNIFNASYEYSEM
jgi:hypothetical protein